jgi:hypothetical protein
VGVGTTEVDVELSKIVSVIVETVTDVEVDVRVVKTVDVVLQEVRISRKVLLRSLPISIGDDRISLRCHRGTDDIHSGSYGLWCDRLNRGGVLVSNAELGYLD